MQWTSTRRLGLVLSILKGERSVAEASRLYGLPATRIEEWRARALRGAERELRPETQSGWSSLEHYVESL